MFKRVAALGFAVVGGLSVGVVGAYSKHSQNSDADELYTLFHDEIEETLGSESRLRSVPIGFYRYTSCPHSGKVQALLDYYNIDYHATEVHPLTKKQIRKNGHFGVPQVSLGGEIHSPLLLDANRIIDHLYPVLSHAEFSNEQRTWANWATDQLLECVIWNSNRSFPEAKADYWYVDKVDSFSWWDKRLIYGVGVPLKYFLSNKVARSEQFGSPDPRKSLFMLVDQWVDNGLQGNQYHGGDTPDIVDLIVFGILYSKRNQPLYDDITQHSNVLSDWLTNMDDQVGFRGY